jgi:hypothetical protein
MQQGAIAMGYKTGRKRKVAVSRERNGRPQRGPETVAYWQREIAVLRYDSRRPELGTPLGVLVRGRRITERLFTAGIRFSEQRKAADEALSIARRTPTGLDVNNVRGASLREDGPDDERRKRRAAIAFDAALAAVGVHSGMHRALQWVVVEERMHESHEQFLDLVEGLTRLAAHYRL